MAGGKFKVTIANQDYHNTTYVVWVGAASKNAAIAKAAALAGQEQMRREFEHSGRVMVETFLEPHVRLEPVSLDEYWKHEDEITCSTS